jgi:hypothetical protein
VKPVHCRRCWQPIPRLSKRCAQCGELDLLRFAKGVVEVLSYGAIAAAATGLAIWSVARIML